MTIASKNATTTTTTWTLPPHSSSSSNSARPPLLLAPRTLRLQLPRHLVAVAVVAAPSSRRPSRPRFSSRSVTSLALVPSSSLAPSSPPPSPSPSLTTPISLSWSSRPRTQSPSSAPLPKTRMLRSRTICPPFPIAKRTSTATPSSVPGSPPLRRWLSG